MDGEIDFGMNFFGRLDHPRQIFGDLLVRLDYDLTGAASIDLPFLRNLPFHQSGTLKLPGSQ